ncbi:hypothetical protein FKM82_007311 [Ascaphus truei]
MYSNLLPVSLFDIVCIMYFCCFFKVSLPDMMHRVIIALSFLTLCIRRYMAECFQHLYIVLDSSQPRHPHVCIYVLIPHIFLHIYGEHIRCFTCFA